MYRSDAEALVAHGRFLAEKFGHGSRRRPARRHGVTRRPPAAAAPTLSAALATLEEVGRRAGVPDGVARAEGAALAAALAESAPGAAQAWAGELGGDIREFFDAASSARRWRQAPTAVLSGLVESGSPHAADYARALAEVTTAACGLGEPTLRVVANASVTAAAQLGAVGGGGQGAFPGLPVPGTCGPRRRGVAAARPGRLPDARSCMASISQTPARRVPATPRRPRRRGRSRCRRRPSRRRR